MPADEKRSELQRLVERCQPCGEDYRDNVALLVADDDGQLTDAQVEAVLHHLQKKHRRHANDVQ